MHQAVLEDADGDWSDIYKSKNSKCASPHQTPKRSKEDFFPGAFTGIPVPLAP